MSEHGRGEACCFSGTSGELKRQQIPETLATRAMFSLSDLEHRHGLTGCGMCPGQTQRLAFHQLPPYAARLCNAALDQGWRGESAPSGLAGTGLAGDHCRAGCRRLNGRDTRQSARPSALQRARGFLGQAHGAKMEVDPGQQNGLGDGGEGSALSQGVFIPGPPIPRCGIKTSLRA